MQDSETAPAISPNLMSSRVGQSSVRHAMMAIQANAGVYRWPKSDRHGRCS
jgi:hypothetical protein